MRASALCRTATQLRSGYAVPLAMQHKYTLSWEAAPAQLQSMLITISALGAGIQGALMLGIPLSVPPHARLLVANVSAGAPVSLHGPHVLWDEASGQLALSFPAEALMQEQACTSHTCVHTCMRACVDACM